MIIFTHPGKTRRSGMSTKYLILCCIIFTACGLTKDLKDTRALGKPYYKKLDEIFFKHAQKQGFVYDGESYSLLASNDLLVSHILPVKKSLFEQDLHEGALIGYAMVLAKGND